MRLADALLLILGGCIVLVCISMLAVVLVRPPVRLRTSGRRAQTTCLFIGILIMGVDLALYAAADLGILLIGFPVSVWLHYGLNLLMIGTVAAALLIYPP